MIFAIILSFLFGVIGFAALGFWIWMIVDCLKKDFKNKNEKVIWVLAVILCNVLGAVIYFFVARKEK